MLKLLIVLFATTTLPNKIDGIWEISIDKNNWMQVAFQEQANNSLRAVVVIPVAGRAAFIPFSGEITRSKDSISMVVSSSSYKVSDECKVSFALIANGTIKGNPLRFETKARIVNYISCTGKAPRMQLDNVSGSWKFLRSLPQKPQPSKGITI